VVQILDLIEDHIPEALEVLHFGLFGASLVLTVVDETYELFEALVYKEVCFADCGPDLTERFFSNTRFGVHNVCPLIARLVHAIGLRLDQLSEVIGRQIGCHL